jgi:hypothetical protein
MDENGRRNVFIDSCERMTIYYLIDIVTLDRYWSRVVSGTEQKNSTSLFLPWMSYKTTKGLIAFIPELDCDQTAIGLPPVCSITHS